MTQHRRVRGGAIAARRFAPSGAILAFLTTTALVLGITAGPATGDETDAVAVTDTVAPQIADVEDSDPADGELVETPDASESDAGLQDEASDLDDNAGLDGELGLDTELGLEGDLVLGELPTITEALPLAVDGPYLAWTAVDGAGNPLGGATFRLQGPRVTDSNWGPSYDVVDNGSYDLDDRDGHFIVKNLGTDEVQQGDRYRLRPQEAPDGYTTESTDWASMGRNAWNADGTYTFPNAFPFLNGHTIVVNKADMRTGLGAAAVSQEYVEGVRFALYTSQNGTTIYDNRVCEIAAGSTQCVFEGVPNRNNGYWVGEIEPAAGTPAALHYSDPISQLRTSSTQNYRYSTGAVGGNFSTYTVPRSGSNPSATSGYFVNRIANPPLHQTCDAGVKVALVMDLSGSIDGYQDELAKSASGLVDGLTGTDSSVALFSFSTESPATRWSGSNTNDVLIPNHPAPQSVATQAGADIVKGWYSNNGGLTANFTPSGGTNWDAALYNVAENISAYNYDIVFMLTDGDPTFSSSDSADGRQGSGNSTTFREVERAVLAANVIKDKGTRVVSVGVGSGVQGSAVNLAAISGPQSSGASLSDIDYTITGWSELAKLLKDFAQEISCQATVTVEKLTAEGDEDPEPAAGWEFTTEAPGAVVAPDAVQKTAGDEGSATWNLQFDSIAGTTSVDITETQQEGWTLDDLVCNLDDQDLEVDLGETVTISNVGIGDNVHCVFTNKKSLSTLTLVKDIEGLDGGLGVNLFDPEAGVNQWTLSAVGEGDTHSGDANDAGVAVEKVNVKPGEYTLSEALRSDYADKADGYELKSLTCVDTSRQDAESWDVDLEGEPGIELTGKVEIEANEHIECTFLNSTLPGSIGWEKIAENGKPLAGSEWDMIGPFSGEEPDNDAELRLITEDGGNGQFKVENLVWGTYIVTETQAPAGFEWTEEEGAPSFRVTLTASDREWHATSEGNGPITNDQVRPVTLPIAGGSGTWMYLGGGTLLLLLGAGGWLLVTRRQQGLRIVSGEN